MKNSIITKWILGLVCIALSSTNGLAQENDLPGFGGAYMGLTDFAGIISAEAGGFGAAHISPNFYLGGAGYGLSAEEGIAEYTLGYGGLLAGYVFNPDKKVQFYGSMLAAIGGVEENIPGISEEDSFLAVIRPGIGVDFKILRWCKLELTASYRQALFTKLEVLGNSDVSGLSTGFSFKFGNFYPKNN